jgi:hypothetical protein
MQAIIYPNETTVSFIRPLSDAHSIQEIARKDVPFGVPYRIIDAALIPADRTYREAWTADFSAPDGVGLGQNRWWIEQFMAEIAQLEAQEESEERTAAIAALQAKIETMKAEVLEIEGVQL